MCIPLQEKTESLCVYYECKQLFSPLARRLFFFLCIVICVLVLLFLSLFLFFFFSLSLLFCEALLSPSLMRVSRASVSNISFCLKVSSGTCDGSQNGYGTEQQHVLARRRKKKVLKSNKLSALLTFFFPLITKFSNLSSFCSCISVTFFSVFFFFACFFSSSFGWCSLRDRDVVCQVHNPSSLRCSAQLQPASRLGCHRKRDVLPSYACHPSLNSPQCAGFWVPSFHPFFFFLFYFRVSSVVFLFFLSTFSPPSKLYIL